MGALTVGGLFDGIGLLALGLHRAGLEHRWLCEIDPFRREVLARRWPGVPVFDDVRAVGAGAPRVDVIAGGFPCKGASSAGKRQGFGHPETVLWREMARTVRELRPRYVVVENVADILRLHDGAVWGEVLGTLATLGYDTVWDCLPAAAVGAPHLRDRVFAIAAHTDSGARLDEQLGVADGLPARSDAAGLGGPAPADSAGPRGATGRERQRAGRGQSGARRRDHAEPGPQAAADARRGRQPEQPAEHGTQPAQSVSHTLGRGVPVEWGDYEPAVRRWEAIAGPAPEPLVRRMDDRRAAGVERSRLSALGDGVQVQIGELIGVALVERAGRG